MRNPTAITPDQFQPARVDGQQNVVPAAKFAPTPTPAPAPPPIAQQSQTPLQPTARESASPFARRVDLPPPPAQQQPANTPPPERIIERIRDVPVAPAPPPKAMTAAAQSVIGPLSQRGAGRWQSRQEV
ncbi:hypothetical protein [Yoonia sp.]|uniref:hypothetical protein n=1 Tax=Yoonia sp. TaxID=2212373 RepID=UPI0025FEE611|nr:hypothetical protein [Yoonia sp.]